MQKFVDREEDRVAREQLLGHPVKDRVMPHMRLTGPAGTGKTTTATKLAPILHHLGLTENEKVVSVKAGDLVGSYQGGTEEKVDEALADAKGGVLVIDEAHQLADTAYGKIALKQLIQPMDNPKNKTVIMFAGYEQEMKALDKVDPGFKSRTPNVIPFQRFTLNQMLDHADKVMEDAKFTQTDDAHTMMDRVFTALDQTEHDSMRDANNIIAMVHEARTARVKASPKMKIKDRMVVEAGDWSKGYAAWKAAQ